MQNKLQVLILVASAITLAYNGSWGMAIFAGFVAFLLLGAVEVKVI